MDSELKRQIMIDNYSNPFHKETKGEDYICANANNASCIDNINIYVKVNNDIIIDAYFDGEACAISTSSTSIMIRNIIGMNINDAKYYVDNFMKMINEEEYDKSVLKDALAYDEIYKQNSRKTCASLPYTALIKIICK